MTRARPAPRADDGFSLVEVLVGLLVLELGLLGVAGLVAVSGRFLARAARTERALYVAEEVADSLVGVGTVSDGERIVAGGRLRWRVAGGAGGLPLLRIDAADPDGRRVLVLHALLPVSGATPVDGEDG